MTDNTEALREALATAEAALADIGDAEREPGDDLAWCERRAAYALPAVRAALAQQAATPTEPATDALGRKLEAERDAIQGAERAIRENPSGTLAIIRSLQNQRDEARAAIAASRQAATPAPAEPVARVRIGNTGLGKRASFCALTDAGRALPSGAHDLYAAPPATPAAQPAGWTITAPDGQQWTGATPFKAASAAQRATITEEEARAMLARLQACAAREAADMQAEHEHLNCPACGGSGHVEDARAGWISIDDRLPEVPAGSSRRFFVACRRGHDGKTYTFEAEYLNGKFLADDGVDDGDELGGRPHTGWYDQQYTPNDDSTYVPVCADGDEVTHWRPLPAAPTTQETT